MSRTARPKGSGAAAAGPVAHTLGRRRRAAARGAHDRRSAMPAGLSAPERASLVGLDAERGRLLDLWADAGEGAGHVALLGGEPGVGKTRLAREVAHAARRDDARVLWGTCVAEDPAPYGPVREALAAVAAELGPGWLSEHARNHGPGLGRLLGDPALSGEGGPGAENSSSPARMYTAIQAVLAELARQGPVLLVLEDLHWATRSTVRLLRHLLASGPDLPLLVVGTFREGTVDQSHPLGALVAAAPTPGRISRLVVEGLSRREVGSFIVDRVALAGSSGGRLATTLWRVTEGNPLFLVETLRDLVEEGAVVAGQVHGAALAQWPLPLDLDELVARRLRRQDDVVREVVEAASVAGAAVVPELVAQTMASRVDAVEAGLRRASATGLVRQEPDGAWHFAHAAFAEAVARSLAPSRRVRLHERIAAALERRAGAGVGAASAARLTHHYLAATPVGGSQKALHHAIRAAEEAGALLAYDEAAEHYGQALSMLGGASGAPTLRADLLLDLGEAHRHAGEQLRARQAFVQAAFGARASGDGPRLARATLALGSLDIVSGADEELIGLIDRALEATRDDPALQAQLLGRLAQARAGLDGPDERKARSDRAWELAWDSRDPATMGTVLVARHQALSAPDDLDDRIETAGELLAMATAAGDEDMLLRAHGWRFVDLLERGRVGDADRDLNAHARLARQVGDPRHRRDATGWKAARALLAGDRERAAALADRAQALGQEAGDTDGPSVYWAQQWALVLDRGQAREVADLLPVWRDLARAHDRHPCWQARLALLLAESDRRAEAAALLEDLLAEPVPVDRTWLPTLAVLAEVAVAVQAAAEGDRLAGLLTPYVRRIVVFEGGWATRGAVARAAALASVAAGRWSEADRHFAVAQQVHDQAGAGPARATADYEWARALLARAEPGDRVRAHDLLADATTEADRLAMTGLAAQCRELARSARC